MKKYILSLPSIVICWLGLFLTVSCSIFPLLVEKTPGLLASCIAAIPGLIALYSIFSVITITVWIKQRKYLTPESLQVEPPAHEQVLFALVYIVIIAYSHYANIL